MMYIQIEYETALKVAKQLVCELEIGKPLFLTKLQEVSSVFSSLAYEMKDAVAKQEKINA